MEESGFKFLIFKFKKVHTCDVISSIQVKTEAPGFLFTRTYDVVVEMESGKEQILRRFESEVEADSFCCEIKSLVFWKSSRNS
jgi:hypothetical protein